MRECTVHSIKHFYLNEVKKMRVCGSEGVLESLTHRKQGRPLLLGDKLTVRCEHIYKGYVKKEVLCLLKLLLELLQGSCPPLIRQN